LVCLVAIEDPVPPGLSLRWCRARASGPHTRLIDGNAEKVTDDREAWTFARNISSRDPNWKIVATAAEQ
jgi:predicted lipid-binding transport protein (Tim44 family)